MSDERDPKLQALFAESHASNSDADFVLRVAEQVQMQIRHRRWRIIAAVIALLAVLAALTPWMLSLTTLAAEWAERSRLAESLAWLVSLIIGFSVLRRWRVF